MKNYASPQKRIGNPAPGQESFCVPELFENAQKYVSLLKGFEAHFDKEGQI